MPSVTVYNEQGEQVGELELSPAIFAAEVNTAVLRQVVDLHLARQRTGTASTKSRGEVRGGGRKPWRQKGTGRARHGTIRSPLWRGGAVTFGPKPRDYGGKIPRKMKRMALRSALSSKVNDDQLRVLEELEFPQPHTRRMVQLLHNLGLNGSTLLVTAGSRASVYKSARNIPGVAVLPVDNLNVYEVLRHNSLVLTRDAVARVEEVWA